jgi:probable HAF family extracellular repeat protein
MKRLGTVIFLLSLLLSMTRAQQTSAPGKTRPARHRAPQTARSAQIQTRLSLQSNNVQGKIWEFETYPGGTWAALNHINNFGVAVGSGDVPAADGVLYTHTLALPLFGPKAGTWIDLGSLGGTQTTEWEEPLSQISDTEIITGHSTMPSGYVHGFVWSKPTGMRDLGTLADIGYSAYNSSWALATNNLGNLIAGWSGIEVSCLDCAAAWPVVWTPSLVWKNGRPDTEWNIHKLPTAAFPNLTRFYVFGVNDAGQIVAIAWNEAETVGRPILWNPVAAGNGWKAMTLPADPDYPYIIPFGINNKGEIVGASLSADASQWNPRLWKPLNAKRTAYSKPVELPIPEGLIGCEAVGINELGDITGDCYSDTTNVSLLWSSKDPHFAQIISYPGDWSFAWGVNNSRIAVVTYGGGENCSADNYGSCGGAVQIR